MIIMKYQFEAYERVRQSGVTNMFDTKRVAELTGLCKEEILEIMKRYDEFSELYLKPHNGAAKPLSKAEKMADENNKAVLDQFFRTFA